MPSLKPRHISEAEATARWWSDGSDGLAGAGGFGVLRRSDCRERNHSAQDDRVVGVRAGSRFLAALGMTERRATANANTGVSPLRITKTKA